jgi:hypothetical protein
MALETSLNVRTAGEALSPTGRRRFDPDALPNATRRYFQRRPSSKCAPYQMVEGKGFEPSTSALRTPRSPN